jgi:hypothetical protein
MPASFFCEFGTHSIAWRGLALLLRVHLDTYFPHHKKGLLVDLSNPFVRSAPYRVHYLANLAITQLGYLITDALLVSYRRSAEFITTSDELLPCTERFQAMTRENLLLLPQYDFQILLVEITNELNKRTSLISHLFIGSMLENWSPSSGTDLGILRYVNFRLSSDDDAILLRFDIKKALGPKCNPPRKLLQRALSAGSRTSIRRRLSFGKAFANGRSTSPGLTDPTRITRVDRHNLKAVVRPQSGRFPVKPRTLRV